MILVTGAAGFIGSKFIKYLNNHGIADITACDYLTNGHQYSNLLGLKFNCLLTPDRALSAVEKKYFSQVYHFGAVSDTTCWDGELMLSRNTQYSIDLISLCDYANTPVQYSSSASVYGNGNGPLNLYAYSKYLIDQYVEEKLKFSPESKIQGFRYFNVWSDDDAEWHKKQPSPHYKFKQQVAETGRIEVFEGSEHVKRDFVHVNRICEIQYQMMNLDKPNGIFDLGSGVQSSFLDVANYIKNTHGGEITEVPFPEELKAHYQYNTIADMSYLSFCNIV